MRRAPRAVLGDRLPRSARSGRGTLDSGGSRGRRYAARQCRASPRKCEPHPWSIVWGSIDFRTELTANDVEGIDPSRRRAARVSNAARARPAGRSRTPPAFQRPAPPRWRSVIGRHRGLTIHRTQGLPAGLGRELAAWKDSRPPNDRPWGARGCGASGIGSRFSWPPSSSQSYSCRLLSIAWLPRFSLPRSPSP